MPELEQPSLSPNPGNQVKFKFLDKYQKLIWIFLLTAAALTAGLLVYILFFQNRDVQPTYNDEVKLTIDAPVETPSGSELSYEILAENNSDTTLTSVVLEIFYPRGFSFVDSTPDAEDGQARKFNIPNLSEGEEYKVVIVGRLSGSVQEIKPINLKLHYIPENFRTAFTKEATANTVILAPDLSVQISAPNEIVTGQTIRYDLEITNISDRAFPELFLKLVYPDKFEFETADPPPASDDENDKTQWTIKNLGVSQSRQISISGKIFESAGKESLIQAEILLPDEFGQLSSAGRTFAFTEVRPAPLLISQAMIETPDPIYPGEELRYEVKYENRSNIAVSNVVIATVFETPVFDLSRIDSDEGQLSAGSLKWTPATAPELLVVDPGQKGSFVFTVPVSARLVLEMRKNPLGKTRVEYTAKELSETVSGNILEFKVQTQVTLHAISNVAGGENPPQEGQTTVYRVEVEIENTVNDLVDAEFSAIMPRLDTEFDSVSILPTEEADNVQFVPVTGRLKWKIGKIFALSGSFHERRKISFEFKTTPRTEESLHEELLLKDLVVSGTDEFTGKKITSNKIDDLVRQQPD